MYLIMPICYLDSNLEHLYGCSVVPIVGEILSQHKQRRNR
jgi:hypothetical protein